jgi:hypothetical protein
MEEKPVPKKLDPLAEIVEKAGMTVLQDFIGKGQLEARARAALQDSQLVWALYTIRKTGKVELPVADVRGLVANGLAGVDDKGFFLTPVVEDLLDRLEKKLEERGVHPNGG